MLITPIKVFLKPYLHPMNLQVRVYKDCVASCEGFVRLWTVIRRKELKLGFAGYVFTVLCGLPGLESTVGRGVAQTLNPTLIVCVARSAKR